VASAQSFTLWQQATIAHMPWSLCYCLFVPRTYGYCSSRTSRSWWITHLMQLQRRVCNTLNVLCCLALERMLFMIFTTGVITCSKSITFARSAGEWCSGSAKSLETLCHLSVSNETCMWAYHSRRRLVCIHWYLLFQHHLFLHQKFLYCIIDVNYPHSCLQGQ